MKVLKGVKGAVKGKDEKDKELKKLQKEEERQKKIESLLPWGLQQRVALCLHPIKTPLIFLVWILGSLVEWRIRELTSQTWTADVGRDGPTCVVHNLDLSRKFNTTIAYTLPEQFAEPINRTVFDVIRKMNLTGSYSLDSGMLGINYTFAMDRCGISDQGCEVSTKGTGMNENSSPQGLSQWRLPWLTYSTVWAVYKLVFLPIHWPDRILNLMAGYGPYSEPMFKLVTEPYFQHCSGAMGGLVTVGVVFRYSMLANCLLVPLETLAIHPKCPHLIHYDFDTWLAKLIYFWCIGDFILTWVVYALGKTLFNGKCIGTCMYRIYKAYWFVTVPIAAWLWFSDFVMVFEWRFWEGLMILFKLNFEVELDFTWNFTLDVVQWLVNMVIIFDTLQLVILIMSLLCPVMLARLPGMESLMAEEEVQDESEDEGGTEMTRPLRP